MRTTQTIGEYRKERNKALKFALAKIKESIDNSDDDSFTYHNLQHMIKEYERINDISIETPIKYDNYDEFPENTPLFLIGKTYGGFPFHMYQRVNRALNRLVINGVLDFKVVKNTRHYFFV